MIVKLKEARIFFPRKGKFWDEVVRRLGNLLGDGIHIEHIKIPEGESIDRSKERINRVTQALKILEEVVPIENESRREELLRWSTNDPTRIIRNVLQAHAVKVKAKEELKKCKKQFAWYEKWNTSFRLKDLEKLAKSSIFLTFYSATQKSLEKIPEEECVQIYPVGKNQYQVILISRDSNATLEMLSQDAPPPISFGQLKNCITRRKRQIEKSDEVLSTLVIEANLLKEYLIKHENNLKEREARQGMEQIEDQIPYMKCYVPKEQLPELEELVKEYSLGLMIMEVEDDDEDVPTLIKRPKWLDTVDPIMNFMGLIPGYRETDVSLVFLVFFLMFSSIIVGDAGYGLIFVLGTFIFHAKKKFIQSNDMNFLYALSGGICLWGVLTGTYFGSEVIAEIPFLKSLSISHFTSDNPNAANALMKFGFFIGALHLTFARIIKGLTIGKSLKAVAELGWISIVWGLFFVVNMLIIKEELPSFLPSLFIGGVLVVALFSAVGERNYVKSFAVSLSSAVLGIINGFSDVLSYIRLYAVSLATSLIAQCFNNLAIGEGIDSVFSAIAAVLILVVGHVLNIGLAALAVIIHSGRLKILEFGNHSNVSYSGTSFNKFKFNNQLITKL
jgi:V/A-type H+/Na+-transporting ATPase subunit I